MILLFTNDSELEESVAQALSEVRGLSHLTHCAGDALNTVCGVGHELDLAIIDFDHAHHGISLLSAINMCCRNLPVLVIAREEERHVDALAHACGAFACLHKPVAREKISATIKQFCQPAHELALVA